MNGGDTRRGDGLECKIHRLLAYKVRYIYQAGEERQGETRGGPGGGGCWSSASLPPSSSHMERETETERHRERERAWPATIAASREALAGKFKRSAIRHQIDQERER